MKNFCVQILNCTYSDSGSANIFCFSGRKKFRKIASKYSAAFPIADTKLNN